LGAARVDALRAASWSSACCRRARSVASCSRGQGRGGEGWGEEQRVAHSGHLSHHRTGNRHSSLPSLSPPSLHRSSSSVPSPSFPSPSSPLPYPPPSLPNSKDPTPSFQTDFVHEYRSAGELGRHRHPPTPLDPFTNHTHNSHPHCPELGRRRRVCGRGRRSFGEKGMEASRMGTLGNRWESWRR